MNNNAIMQEMINNHEACRIIDNNGQKIIKLRPKAIDESLIDKLSNEDIKSAKEIISKQIKINDITRNLCNSCNNTNCSNRHNCLPVLPNGNINSQVMIINKMPSTYETGMMCSMCGTNGSFLSLILSKMGISRNDIYCTDMIKCETQLDEYSFNECINTYLLQEIELMSPKIIICNGLSVLKTCVKNDIFANLSGSLGYGNIYNTELKNGNQVKVIAIYDLETVLKKTGDDYNKCKNELWSQILKAFKSLQEG